MLIASVVGGVVSAAVALGVGIVVRDRGPLADVVGWGSIVLFPASFLVIHWATIGARRWTAIELVVWAGRMSAARYSAATGIRDPVDRNRAEAWMASAPRADGEPAEQSYWRAYALLLAGDEAAARTELGGIDAPDLEFDVATLAAQIDLAEGKPTDVGTLERLLAGMPPSLERAVAAVEVGALRSQVAWTCDDDDVTPVLEALPLVEGRATGTLLRRYWLPLAAVVVAVWAALWLLLSFLG
jgi:hypothetical protein